MNVSNCYLAPEYASHLQSLLTRYRTLMDDQGAGSVVIHAGALINRYHDDQAYPFSPYAMAQQWLPFRAPPELFVVLTPQGPPRLLFPVQQDFWHLTPQVPPGDWQTHWQVDPYTDAQAVLTGLPQPMVWLGPEHDVQRQVRPDSINPEAWLTPLYYDRGVKTDWEVTCLAAASRRGVLGHQAAQAAFEEGLSEALIHQRFLAASQQVAAEEPYPGIVGLNEAAATLHYEQRRFDVPERHRTLLIDAGASVCGYASDITRTHTTDTGLFAELLARMDSLQQTLCRHTVAGQPFPELHEQARWGVATILYETGLCRHTPEHQLALRIPYAFFPHGLGHLLGLQVHDAGGRWQSRDGQSVPPPETAPALRLTRTLEAGMVLTIEPGLYFIPMLLDNLVRDIPDHGCDLDLIESLLPFGGIRIEDNLVVGEATSRNLTREAGL